MSHHDENGIGAGTVFLSFLAGAAVGAGVALLLAPKTGAEMRGAIADLAEDAVDKIKDLTKEAQEKIVATYEEGKQLAKEQKTILSAAIQAGKEAIEKEKERLKDA